MTPATDRPSPTNAQSFADAQSLLPGGVNSPVRAFRAVGGAPPFIARAQGPYLWDLEGRKYIDYVGSWGAAILGHAHPAVVQALQSAAALGLSFGAPTAAETELARRITHLMPAVEMVRLCNSGTEAAMTALRLARAFTRRPKLIKFAGCYHGHADPFLVQAGSGATTLGTPTSPGIPPAVAADTLVAQFNNLDSVQSLFAQHPGRIAALIVEPVVGNAGVIPPADGFLAGLRQLTAQAGALLIFDEVITGFRLAPGGAQQLYGLAPDLTALGKIIGGGLPVGAVAGRRNIMQLLAPAGPVYQAGTLSGNPLAVAAGLATLDQLTPHTYELLERRAAQLEAGFRHHLQRRRLPWQFQRLGSLATLFFTDRPVRNYADALTCDTRAFARYFHAMLAAGIYLPPSQFEAFFLSAAHSDDDLARTLQAVSHALSHAAPSRP